MPPARSGPAPAAVERPHTGRPVPLLAAVTLAPSRPRRAGAMHLAKAAGLQAASDCNGPAMPASWPSSCPSGYHQQAIRCPRHSETALTFRRANPAMRNPPTDEPGIATPGGSRRPNPRAGTGRDRTSPGLSIIAVQQVRQSVGLSRDPVRRSAAPQQRESAQSAILRDIGNPARISKPCRGAVGTQKAPGVRAAPAEPGARCFPCQPRLPRVP